MRIHRIREALSWSHEACDRVLASVVAGSHVALHGGDQSRLRAAEVADSSQDARGTLSLTVSGRGA